MLGSLKNFFDRHIAAAPDADPAADRKRAQVAAAALLIEVARSDEQFSAAERQAVLESVQRKFSLDQGEAQQLLELAEAQAHQAHDLFQFTSQINAQFTPQRKARLIEELWQAAYADKVLHSYEEHLIRRIADLLHVPHATYIATKLATRLRVLGG